MDDIGDVMVGSSFDLKFRLKYVGDEPGCTVEKMQITLKSMLYTGEAVCNILTRQLDDMKLQRLRGTFTP